MAAPTPRDVIGSASPTSDSTTFTAVLPTHVAGDSFLGIIASDGTTADLSSPGWTLIRQGFASTAKLSVFLRDTVAASNAEANPVFSSTASEQFGAVFFSIPGTVLLSADTATPTSGSSAAADAPAITPSGGLQDYLYIAAYAFDGSAGMAVQPTGYSTPVAGSNGVAQGASAIGCYKTASASTSDNPTAATNTNEQWTATVVALWDSGVAPPAPPPVKIIPMLGGLI